MRNYPKAVYELNERVDKAIQDDLYFYLQQIDRIEDPFVYVNGKKMIMLASYSYLSLLQHPRINQLAKEAIDQYGTGTHGVRILAGTEPIHNQLEKTIARFKKREEAVVFSSGYVANLTTISSLFHKGDVVICDKFDHASIVDGCLLSGAEFLRFNHNSLTDLERVLKKSESYRNRCIIIDSVYSMDGDIAPLPDIVELAKKYGALLYVDEAHSMGVLGENGTGIEEYFNIEGSVDILMGTMSKVLPGIGGYVAGDKILINFLKHISRAFVFSAALPPPVVAAGIGFFEVLEQEKWRIKKLNDNIHYFIRRLNEEGFNTLQSQTAIIPLIIGDEEKTMKTTRFMQDRGIFVLPILPPAVPPNTARLRMNVCAAMDKEHLDLVIDTLVEAKKLFQI
ncbi:MAG TPA: pyridoxal phosphate-dependent aminotransferase family protein [Caldisericia bacterium]|nr:pyridoxal phosphate-dependent aminotransferase family protein [Caldisericia bacterium]